MLEQYGDFVEAITSSIRFPWKAFSTLLSILTSHIISFCNYGIALKVCIRKTFLYDSKIWPATAKDTRGYFRKTKRLGIERFVKKCPFWKKTFSWFEKCQKQLPMRGYSIYTYCSWSPKSPFVKESWTFIESFFKKNFVLK